jgi:hypothetical protein
VCVRERIIGSHAAFAATADGHLHTYTVAIGDVATVRSLSLAVAGSERRECPSEHSAPTACGLIVELASIHGDVRLAV